MKSAADAWQGKGGKVKMQMSVSRSPTARKLTGPLRVHQAVGRSALPPDVRAFLLVLVRWVNFDTWLFDPSIESIARHLGRRPNTARQWRDRAESAGAISLVRDSRGGHCRTKQYRLEIEAIEAMNCTTGEEMNSPCDEEKTPRPTGRNPSSFDGSSPHPALCNSASSGGEQTSRQTNEHINNRGAAVVAPIGSGSEGNLTEADEIVRLLIAVGVSREVAPGLARLTTITKVKQIIQRAQSAENPPGYIVAAIRRGWEPRGVRAAEQLAAKAQKRRKEIAAAHAFIFALDGATFERLRHEAEDALADRGMDMREVRRLKRSEFRLDSQVNEIREATKTIISRAQRDSKNAQRSVAMKQR